MAIDIVSLDKINTKLLNVGILLLVFLNSGGVDVVSHYFITLATIFLLIIKILLSGRFSPSFFCVSFSGFFTALVVNYFAVDFKSGISEYLVYVSYVLNASLFLMAFRFDRNSLEDDLYLTLKLILFHCLLTFFMQFAVGRYIFPLTSHQSTFYYIFYYIPFGNLSGIFRNQGIFWEPGVLQFYLNILFYFSSNQKKNTPVAFLTIFAILTTFSTTGFIILFIQLLPIIYHWGKNRRGSAFVIFILFPLILAPLALNIDDKFSGESANSSNVRMFDLVVGFDLLINHPIVGVGLDREVYKDLFFTQGMLQGDPEQYGIQEDVLKDKGITNSILFMATTFGLPIALMLFYFLYNQNLIRGNKIIIFTISMLTGFSEPLFNTVLFTILFASGWMCFIYGKPLLDNHYEK